MVRPIVGSSATTVTMSPAKAEPANEKILTSSDSVATIIPVCPTAAQLSETLGPEPAASRFRQPSIK